MLSAPSSDGAPLKRFVGWLNPMPTTIEYRFLSTNGWKIWIFRLSSLSAASLFFTFFLYDIILFYLLFFVGLWLFGSACQSCVERFNIKCIKYTSHIYIHRMVSLFSFLFYFYQRLHSWPAPLRTDIFTCWYSGTHITQTQPNKPQPTMKSEKMKEKINDILKISHNPT